MSELKTTQEADVLIVGAGPVGQMAALLLSAHGIPSVLIDKRTVALSAPKAHAVNPRTLEICESMGVSADQLRALGASANDGGDVRFVGTLTGPEFGHLPYERQDDAALADTPFPLSNIPQPAFEQVLLDKIGKDSNITFCRGIACTAAVQDDDGVEVTLLETGMDVSINQRFAYVVGADGAGSSIRRLLDIEMEGPEALQDFLMIHFTADLRDFTTDRRGVLYFLFEPGVNGALIAYDQASTWVLMHPWLPATEKLEDYDESRCRALIEQAIGRPFDAVQIENISPWSMSAQIAERYRTGRVFLVGDAAHRFPPAGGLGLNTGVGDVQNLTWKLAAVLQGSAGEGLLETYETERRPVAQVNSEQSMMNAAKIFDLFVAIHGPDPAQSASHYAAVSANPQNFPELAEAVAAQKPHFDSFNLQLGYRYDSPAIFESSSVAPISDVSDYRPSWDVGAHFPHRWIQVEGRKCALQSLLPATEFSVLYGPTAILPGLEGINELQFGHDFSDDEPWSTLTGLPDDGALLVRPDGHITGRFDQLSGDKFSAVMATVLARGV